MLDGGAAGFLALVFAVAILSGATASIAGFGIGSLLTPLFAAQIGMTTAIAAVSIPHAFATAVRCWRLRRSIDWSVIRSFGLLSVLGSLAGALLYARFSNRALTIALALLLIATAIAGLTDWARRVHPGPRAAGALGVASGLFGGLAGNQGGLRAAALFTFSLAPAAFVATSTATGLLVDAARMPVYVWRAGATLIPHAPAIGVASAGVLIGTLLGERILLSMTAEQFRRVVSALIGLLGVWLLTRA
jgi:uncharacterized membrane protein YfcA